MLGLLRRTFHSVSCSSAKRSLYLLYVRSQLLYCSPLWRPHLITDIRLLETVQRRATRFILFNSSDRMDYKERLMNLNILPLMMEYEISDIIFFIKSIKNPSNHFNIMNYVELCTSNTRSSTYLKLRHSKVRTNVQGQFFFNRIPRLWNTIPPVDVNLPISTIKATLRQYFKSHFMLHFDPNNTCSFHLLCPCHKCSKLPVTVLYHI